MLQFTHVQDRRSDMAYPLSLVDRLDITNRIRKLHLRREVDSCRNGCYNGLCKASCNLNLSFLDQFAFKPDAFLLETMYVDRTDCALEARS